MDYTPNLPGNEEVHAEYLSCKRPALANGLSQGSGIDVFQLTANGNAARNARDANCAASEHFRQIMSRYFTFIGEIRGQNDFLHHAIAGTCQQLIEL